MTATNISGGYDRDKTLRYSDQYILGVNMDLEKILGIHDGEFKASVNNRNGRDLTQDRLQDPRAGNRLRCSEQLRSGANMARDAVLVQKNRVG
jgi:carbohydrate-selective porin OprB